MSSGDALFVLDVGHGSCAAIVQGAQAIVLDVGPGATVLQFLRQRGVTHVESVVISHADADHLGGLIGLLASREVTVGNVYVNSDGVKDSELWKDVAYELDDLCDLGDIVTIVGLAKGDRIQCSLQGWELEVLAPRNRLLQLGVGNRDRDGRLITTNSISVVVRVIHEGGPLALCPGDLDFVGYSHLIDYPTDIKPELDARVLLMPHHGGYSGSASQTAQVVSGLVGAAGPSRIVTSHGRRRHRNPLKIAVDAARSVAPSGARLVCTQMSTNCLAGPHDLGLPRVSPHVSAGHEAGISCAGTAEISIQGAMVGDADHQAMILEHAPHRLCDW